MRRIVYSAVCGLLILVALLAGSGSVPAAAQGGSTGTAISNLNVRTGPGEEYPVQTVISRRTAVNIEARNEWGNWVLVSTPDGVRGWVAARYLILPQTFDVAAVPVAGGDPVSTVAQGSAPASGGAVLPAAPAASGGTPNAWLASELNMRTGPELTFPTITRLPGGTALVLEGRNQNGLWALVHTADGLYRGWVAANFLALSVDVTLADLPVTDGTTSLPPEWNGSAAAPAPAAAAPQPAPAGSSAPAPDLPQPVAYQPVSDAEAALIAELAAAPVLPTITPQVRQIAALGRQMGNNPRLFAKVGDCNSESRGFMQLIGEGIYQLGPYAGLQATIDFFQAGSPNPFLRVSQAGRSGYTANTVVDPLFNDPRSCQPGESPLECEYNTLHPAVAIILFGANDVHNLTADQFAQALRRVLEISRDRGVIPVLATYPSDPAENSKWLDFLRFNQIVVNLGREFGVPVINLWQAARGLPHSGVENDLLHLSYGSSGALLFGNEEMQYGLTLWNLLALQTLDLLRTQVLGG